MLCPEVWNFPYTKNNISIQTGQFDKKNEQILKNLINKHPFNEVISVILPNEIKVPEEISTLIKSTLYYTINDFKLVDLLRRDFIEGFIKRGKFTALSYANSIDIDDVYGVTPDGLLILSINKDLYQSLGLEGRLHKNSLKNKNKYIIQVNLKDSNLQYNGKYFNKIKRSLSHYLLNGIKMRFDWNPHNSEICSSSIAEYFHNLNRSVQMNKQKININHEISLKFPKLINDKNNFQLNNYELFHEFIDCLGRCMLSCELNQNDHLFITNNIEFNENSPRIIHSKGFQTSSLILELIKIIREILNNNVDNNDKNDWIALSICGFKSTPINFFNCDHHFSSNGDNDLIVVFYPLNKFFLYKNISSNKIVK